MHMLNVVLRACVRQVNGVDVTNARHDDVIRLLTSNNCQNFTIVVYHDPNHPLSPVTTSPRSGNLFMPSQLPVNMDSPNYPTALAAVAKRPSPGPQLHISTAATAGSPSRGSAAAATRFVPRPTSGAAEAAIFPADVGKFPADASKSPGVKTVTYSIGGDSACSGVEPPMPLMKVVHQEHRASTTASPRSSFGGVEPTPPSVKLSQGIPCHDGNLLYVTPPAPSVAGSSTGSGVSDLFDALEKTYHAVSQTQHHGGHGYDHSHDSPVARGLSLTSADKKRPSLEVGLLLYVASSAIVMM